MDRAAADRLDQMVAVATHLEDLAGDVHADLLDHAQDVPLGRRGVGADDEIGSAQRVKVGRVVRGVEDAVEKLAELLGRRRRIDVEHAVQGLGGRHVMGLRANAADPRRQVRHLFRRPADAEFFEAAKLGNLQVGVGHFPLVVEEDVDLAVTFQPRDGINRYTLHNALLRELRLKVRSWTWLRSWMFEFQGKREKNGEKREEGVDEISSQRATQVLSSLFIPTFPSSFPFFLRIFSQAFASFLRRSRLLARLKR